MHSGTHLYSSSVETKHKIPEFKASLGYIMRLLSQKKEKENEEKEKLRSKCSVFFFFTRYTDIYEMIIK